MELIELFIQEKAITEGSIFWECKCSQPNLEIIKYLLKNGANINYLKEDYSRFINHNLDISL